MIALCRLCLDFTNTTRRLQLVHITHSSSTAWWQQAGEAMLKALWCAVGRPQRATNPSAEQACRTPGWSSRSSPLTQGSSGSSSSRSSPPTQGTATGRLHWLGGGTLRQPVLVVVQGVQGFEIPGKAGGRNNWWWFSMHVEGATLSIIHY